MWERRRDEGVNSVDEKTRVFIGLKLQKMHLMDLKKVTFTFYFSFYDLIIQHKFSSRMAKNEGKKFK